jgi:hypothetical protein
MPRLSVAAGMIGKTSFFKDVSHFNTVPSIHPKQQWFIRVHQISNKEVLFPR